MDKIMVIGYYTLNTVYEEISNKLIASLDKIPELDYNIVGIDSLGTWAKNTHMKAKVIRQFIEKYPDKKLLYVDVDAIIHSYPKLLDDLDCDIAVRYQDFKWRKNECLSGTVFINNTPNAKMLVDIWIDKNDKYISQDNNPRNWDQFNLDRAIKEFTDINLYVLPPEYTFIFDHMKRIYPNIKPIIEHFQASRKVRGKSVSILNKKR